MVDPTGLFPWGVYAAVAAVVILTIGTGGGDLAIAGLAGGAVAAAGGWEAVGGRAGHWWRHMDVPKRW